jgi:hypothetical protein
MKRKVCILGTHHDYQDRVRLPKLLQNVDCLIQIHNVDLVAEEATGIGDAGYIRVLVEKMQGVTWKNVDLTREERSLVPDLNPDSYGTQIDYDLYYLREWVWVIRTSKYMNDSALLICGMCHLFSIAEKFRAVGFEIETHLLYDQADNPFEHLIETKRKLVALQQAKLALIEIALSEELTNSKAIANKAIVDLGKIV